MKTLKHDIKNNLFILQCIKKTGYIAFFVVAFNVFFETVMYYLNTNIGVWIFDSVDKKTLMQSFQFVILIYVFGILLRLFFAWFDMYTMPVVTNRVTQFLTNMLIDKTFEIRQSEVENPGFYDKYSRAIAEVGTRPGEVLLLTKNIFGGLIQLATLTVVVSKLSLKFTFIFIIAALINTAITVIVNELEYKKYEDSTKINRKLGYVNRVIYQQEFSRLLRNNIGYKGLLKNYLSENVDNSCDLIGTYHPKLYALRILSDMVTGVFFGILPWLISVYGLYSQTMTFGEITIIMNATIFIPDICNKLFGSIVSLRKQSLFINNLREVLDYKEIRTTEGTVKVKEHIETLMETQNISFAYDNASHLTLWNVSMQIHKGEKIVLVGPNGAGKTTLASILSGLYSPIEGKVYLKGTSLEKFSLVQINENIIMVNQDTCMLSFSIAENILQRPLNSLEDYQIVEESLRKVGMFEKVNNFKNGLDTYITKEFDADGVVFSGGEMQKLAIARVYASKAEIVIMDEPTSALDALSEQENMQLLFKLLKDRTIIIISHRLSFIDKVDSVYYLEEGHVKEYGTHLDLMNAKGNYYHLYSAQADKYRLN